MCRLIIICLLGCVASRGFGQTQYQTLPRGFLNNDGPSATSWPVNTSNDQVWQWHYDSSEFDVQGPITISNIAIRASTVGGLPAFNFSDFKVTLIEARTDYLAGSPLLHENILRSQLCRTGSWTGGPFLPAPGASLAGFISIGLTESFAYDPSSGNDFIIQIEKCGPTTSWSANLDAVSGAPAALGGVRRGLSNDCTGEMQNSGPSGTFGIVPIVRIAYHGSSQTLPRGFDTVDGNTAISGPVTSSSDQKWHFHYDSDEFEVQAPIAIREIWVRSANPAAGLAAFSFASFEVTLAMATTDYAAGNRLPQFGQNIDDEKVVRTGAWISGPVAPGGSTGTWIPLGLTESFLYDPSTGQDLIVQVETCGGASPFSGAIDGRLGINIGGNRYGNVGSCTALSPGAAAPLQVAPILRIDYESSNSVHGAIDEFPWREDFDGLSHHGWENLERETRDDPADWIRRSGPTPSAGTGPAGDHTSGFGQYAYVEDSNSDNTSICYLSPPIDLSGLSVPTLSFWIHNQNGGISSNHLQIDVLRVPSGPHVIGIPPAYNSQGSTWNEHTVDLSPFAGSVIRIRFRVNNANNDFVQDIAIDDIRVYEPTVSIGQPAQIAARLDVSTALTPEGVPVTPGLPGPYFTGIHFGADIIVRMNGGGFQPLALWTAPLNVGFSAWPGIGQLDVGLPDLSNFVFVVDGISDPAGPTTGAGGSYSLSVPNTLPPGLTIPLQGGILTGGPSVVALTNAVVVTTR